MPPIQYRSQVMDHLGLVAGMCKELGIADHIDRRAPKISDEWNISHGEAVVAMIMNGLGFTGQSLQGESFIRTVIQELRFYGSFSLKK